MTATWHRSDHVAHRFILRRNEYLDEIISKTLTLKGQIGGFLSHAFFQSKNCKKQPSNIIWIYCWHHSDHSNCPWSKPLKSWHVGRLNFLQAFFRFVVRDGGEKVLTAAQFIDVISLWKNSCFSAEDPNFLVVYKWYILRPLGDYTYATYHLLREPGNSIERNADFISNHVTFFSQC